MFRVTDTQVHSHIQAHKYNKVHLSCLSPFWEKLYITGTQNGLADINHERSVYRRKVWDREADQKGQKNAGYRKREPEMQKVEKLCSYKVSVEWI